MGLRREYHATPQAGGLLTLMVKEMAAQAASRYRLDWVEYSWILEVNAPMRAMAELMAGPPGQDLPRLWQGDLSPVVSDSRSRRYA